MNTPTQNIETFNIQEQLQNVLEHSWNMYSEYEQLLVRLQSLITTLDSSLQLVFDDIIELYNQKIEGDSQAIFQIDVAFCKFRKSKALHDHLISLLQDSKKGE